MTYGVDLSVVVPLYNEQDNVAGLHQAVTKGLAALGLDYELILVDDGSRDATFANAQALVARDARVRVVRLRRNYGQTAAMSAGIRHARGRVLVTMDGDLQNDPADIPRLVAKLDEGFDIVAGWRRRRRDQTLRVLLSRIANGIIARVMGAQVRDTGCSLKAFKAELVRNLPLYGDMHRFIPALSRLAGARLAQMEVNHHPRSAGVSKYGFSRIWKVLLDIVSIRFLLQQARRPLRRQVLAASLLTLAGWACLVYAVAAAPGILLVPASIGILAVSLAVFVGAAGLLGFLYSIHERTATSYALLLATIYAHPPAPGREQ